MFAAKDTVVSIRYTLHVEGELIDQGEMAYLHGHHNIIPGLEEALEGQGLGASLEVSVPPEKGYGFYDPEGQMIIERDAFPADAELVPGAQFYAENAEGQAMPIVIVEVEGDEVTVDSNHPLAGAVLEFAVQITDIRQALPEELDHGHVHGPGGHHH